MLKQFFRKPVHFYQEFDEYHKIDSYIESRFSYIKLDYARLTSDNPMLDLTGEGETIIIVTKKKSDS